MVTKGSWTDNKRVGSFTTIDPKGGEWLDTYLADGQAKTCTQKGGRIGRQWRRTRWARALRGQIPRGIQFVLPPAQRQVDAG